MGVESSRIQQNVPNGAGAISSTKPVVAVRGLQDIDGLRGSFTPLRDLRTIQPVRLVGAAFPASGNDTNFWTLSNNGTASAAAVASIATLTSGTDNNGHGHIFSVRLGRFVYANPNMYHGIVRITDTTVADSKRRWGVFTSTVANPPVTQEGFYYEIDGTGALSVCSVTGGTPTKVSSGSFNGRVTSYTVDTNAHAYEIVYYFLGALFYIDDVLIHTITPTTALMAATLTLPCAATSVNDAGGTTSAVMEVWAATILRLGAHLTESKSVHISTATTTVLKTGSGTLQSVTINNPTNNAITIYDNTAASGTVIAIINPGAVATPFALPYDTTFFTGLTVVTAGTPDLTVTYE